MEISVLVQSTEDYVGFQDEVPLEILHELDLLGSKEML
jgi:hypothetical protein